MEQEKSTPKPAEAPAAAVDMSDEAVDADICVIGGDPAGLAVATAAAAFGRKVVLVEQKQLGGEPLYYGPLATRALAAAGNRAQNMRTATPLGVSAREPEIDLRAVNEHVRSAVSGLAPNFAPERFAGLGIRVLHGTGRFINKRTVIAGESRIRARRFVVATGGVPRTPAIKGLSSIPYLTVETVFLSTEKLHDLIVIGAGADAIELAQTFGRLGSRVMVLAEGKALDEQDPELTKFLIEQLGQEGIGVYENTVIDSVDGGLGRVRVNVTVGAEKHVVEGSHILVAAGLKPATADLGLEAAGIRHDERGIKVNGGLKTTNRRVFAVGRVAAAPGPTAADYQSSIVIQRALLHIRASIDPHLIPRVVYTEPGLAWVGQSEAEAGSPAKKIDVLRWPFQENDRAVAEGAAVGHVKVITSKEGRILGAGIVGAGAGELISMWALALSQGLNIKAMTQWVPAYPTFSQINKQVATSYYAGKAGNPTLRKVIDFLAKFG